MEVPVVDEIMTLSAAESMLMAGELKSKAAAELSETVAESKVIWN